NQTNLTQYAADLRYRPQLVFLDVFVRKHVQVRPPYNRHEFYYLDIFTAVFPLPRFLRPQTILQLRGIHRDQAGRALSTRLSWAKFRRALSHEIGQGSGAV
ncbi:hypothetical protein SERLA73DRAFT_189261, partial [Serpula lacrymans var. lacrymans S7.3]